MTFPKKIHNQRSNNWSGKVKEIKNRIIEFEQTHPKLVDLLQGKTKKEIQKLAEEKALEFIESNKLEDALGVLLLAAEKLFETNSLGEARKELRKAAKIAGENLKNFHREADLHLYCAETLMNYYGDEGWAGGCLRKIAEMHTQRGVLLASDVAERLYKVSYLYVDSHPSWAKDWANLAGTLYDKASKLCPDFNKRERYKKRAEELKELSLIGGNRYLARPLNVVKSLMHPFSTSYLSRDSGRIMGEY